MARSASEEAMRNGQAQRSTVVGIAGPLASGKSTVLGILEELGAVTLRADEVSRQLLQPGQPTLEQVRAAFGEDHFWADGTLQRGKLAALIFADRQARQRLNRIMHPPMVARLRQIIREHCQQAGCPQVIALEAAILHQMGLDQLADKVVLVTAPQGVRIRRLQSRDGLSKQEAQRRVSLHDEMGLSDVAADYVIDATGDLADIRCRVERLWQELVTSAETEGD